MLEVQMYWSIKANHPLRMAAFYPIPTLGITRLHRGRNVRVEHYKDTQLNMDASDIHVLKAHIDRDRIRHILDRTQQYVALLAHTLATHLAGRPGIGVLVGIVHRIGHLLRPRKV